jgi:heme-degrading monooxygenase HmoA
MFARVSRYDLPSDRAHEAAAAFREAMERIGELDGLQQAALLLATDGNRAMTVTFWDTENAMQVSRIAATRARSAAANAVGGEVISTEEFEVAVDVTGRQAGAQAQRSGLAG